MYNTFHVIKNVKINKNVAKDVPYLIPFTIHLSVCFPPKTLISFVTEIIQCETMKICVILTGYSL